jgi:hypothetical protein
LNPENLRGFLNPVKSTIIGRDYSRPFFIYAMPENLENYRETIEDIYRRTKDELWTMPLATLVLLLFAVLFVTIVLNLVFFSFGGWVLSFLVYLLEIAAPLAVLYLHRQKVLRTVREKISGMDSTHPGIYEAFEEWRSRPVSRKS